MDVQPFYDKGPQPLFWAWVHVKKIKISDITNHLKHYVIFMAIAEFTNVAAGWRPLIQTKNKFQPKREYMLPNQE